MSSEVLVGGVSLGGGGGEHATGERVALSVVLEETVPVRNGQNEN